MSRLSGLSPRALLTAAAFAPIALIGAEPAFAVDAPTRTVDLNEAGQRAGGSVLAIGTGAREALLLQPSTNAANAPVRLVARDLVNARTTEVLPAGADVQAVNDDATRVLLATATSHDAADTNSIRDLYVLDRTTGRYLLASKLPTGAAGGTPDAVQSSISGDGRTVFFTRGDSGTIRVKVDTGAATKLSSARLISYGQGSDRTGNVAVAADGIYVGTTRLANPSGIIPEGFSLAKAADNGSVLVRNSGFGESSAIQVVSLATGAARTIALPAWVRAQYPSVVDVNADGTKALLAIRQPRTGGLRNVVGTIDLASGAIAQLGNDLPWSDSAAVTVSPDWAFGAVGPFVAQLGSAPIPGSDVVIPPTGPRPATEYLSLYDGCRAVTNVWPSIPARRPELTLRGALGISPQVPAKADITVTVNSTGVIANKFTLTGVGATRQLTAGFGNFTIAAKVTFKDGTSVSGSRSVSAYKPPTCPVF